MSSGLNDISRYISEVENEFLLVVTDRTKDDGINKNSRSFFQENFSEIELFYMTFYLIKIELVSRTALFLASIKQNGNIYFSRTFFIITALVLFILNIGFFALIYQNNPNPHKKTKFKYFVIYQIIYYFLTFFTKPGLDEFMIFSVFVTWNLILPFLILVVTN